jgi:hypothetical protein
MRSQKLATWGRGYYAKNLQCWRANSLVLKRFLALPGERSPELARVASDVVVPSKAVIQHEISICRGMSGASEQPWQDKSC